MVMTPEKGFCSRHKACTGWYVQWGPRAKGRSRGKMFTGSRCKVGNLLVSIASAHKIRSFFSENHAERCPKAAKRLFIGNSDRSCQTAAIVYSREYQVLYQVFHL